MVKEKGKLPIGLLVNGVWHRDFVLRPRLVSDTVKALEDPRTNDEGFRGVALLAVQIEKLGDIPPDQITSDLLLGMFDSDLGEVMAKAGALEARLIRFRKESEEAQKAAPGAHDGGDPVRASA